MNRVRHTRGGLLSRAAWLGALLLGLWWWLGAAPAAWAVETVTYYHLDALGSPVAATDAQGALLWREAYAPHGARLRNEHGGSERLGYTAKPEETAFGLNYFGARWYDPALGRFLGIDPVAFHADNPHSFNRYAYVSNNPYRYVDPDGRERRDPPTSRWGWSACTEGFCFGGRGGWGGVARPAVAGQEGEIISGTRPVTGARPAAREVTTNTVADSVGAMRRMEFEAAGYHGRIDSAVKSRGPVNGQAALDTSIQVKSTSPRRVGIDYEIGDFVVFDRTMNNVYHGHVRSWKELHPDMQKALQRAGMADRRGNILRGQ